MRKRTRLDAALGGFRALEREMTENIELIELGEAEDDDDIVAEAEAALAALAGRAAKMELESLLSGEADGNDSYVEIHAGAGGTESQDWAMMLVRMYSRWAEAHGYKVEWLEESAGEEAGLKSASLRISAPRPATARCARTRRGLSGTAARRCRRCARSGRSGRRC